MRVSLLVLGVFQITLFLPGASSNCPLPRIKNGYTRKKPGNRVAFFCLSGYSRYGPRTSECEGTNWKSQPPICVAPGCPSLPTNPRRDRDFIHNEAVVMFICLDPFVLVGKATAYCDGKIWSSPAPECQNPEEIENCDFEDGEFCGWEQDKSDDFDWSRHSGETTTGRTGPETDHTLGPTRLGGHYIYIESSAPRIEGDVARLLSPVYPASKSGRCFRFWYHMKGPDGENHVGSLTVSIRLFDELQAAEDHVLFTVKENQGPDWNVGRVFVYKTNAPFRIVLTATRQRSYISDIAVDDISLYNCQGMVTTTKSPSTEITSQATEIETTELATVDETTSAEEMTTRTGYDVTSVQSQSVSVSSALLSIMSSSVNPITSSRTSSLFSTRNDVTTLSTPFSSSFNVTENVDLITTQPNTESTEHSTIFTPTTNEEVDIGKSLIKPEQNTTSNDSQTHKYTPKSGNRNYVFQNEGVIHSVSFVVSLAAGIAVFVIGALIVAFIVHRMKKQTKHYKDDDFETMHTATYRKKSTEGLIL
ncbi:MAM and LDL-receptor class A domain-containing protein 2-like isoform X2 [Ylistrum balloti]|uniref:MAM and LDL-receptor class A domain-containing protein 2-like isoform X2 n=1 Tax=Ylistrum balloti TaxID=509963 RepID=UPI002905F77D|nr:MAM and LDL-receptor class A domain-containing protein 2-like isoform X2 [Ylistrum balloti]